MRSVMGKTYSSHVMIIYMHIFICVVPTVVPVGLRYTALQSRSITLHWQQIPTAGSGPRNMISYKVKVHGCSGIERDTSNTHETIQSLCPNSVYSVSVKACSQITMCGSFSPEIQVKTLEDGM